VIEIIDNNGPNSLQRALRTLLRSASDVRLQVAFASFAGVNSILSALQRAASQGPVRIITGLYQFVTEPAALRLLMRAAEASNGRIQIRLSADTKLHAKLYIIHGNDRVYCVIGSSNLSAEGLSSSGELNLLFADRSTNITIRNLNRRFDDAWTRDSVELTQDIIRHYEAGRPVRSPRTISRAQLRDILGPRARRPSRRGGKSSPEPAFWRDHVAGDVDRATRLVVSQETNWDRFGFKWHSGPSPKLRRGDRLLVFDFSCKAVTVLLAEVRDTVRTSVPTDDGRDFVAYSLFRGQRERPLTPTLWSELIRIGAIGSKRQARRGAKLSHAKLAEVRALLSG
jgi:HKD family nuclease